jgi:hypothetical protein
MTKSLGLAGTVALALLIAGTVTLPEAARAQAQPNRTALCWACVPIYYGASICETGAAGQGTACYQWSDSVGTHCQISGQCNLTLSQESPEELGALSPEAQKALIAAGAYADGPLSVWVVTPDCTGRPAGAYVEAADDRLVLASFGS